MSHKVLRKLRWEVETELKFKANPRYSVGLSQK